MFKVLAAALAASACLLVLAGCDSTGGLPEPVPTATVTETLAATAAPRSADDPLTALDAWVACSGAVRGSFVQDNPDADVLPYSPELVVVQPDGAFAVTVNVLPAGGTDADPASGVQGACLVAGTIGEPELQSFDFTGLG